jgi:signal recognition particle GTPase
MKLPQALRTIKLPKSLAESPSVQFAREGMQSSLEAKQNYLARQIRILDSMTAVERSKTFRTFDPSERTELADRAGVSLGDVDSFINDYVEFCERAIGRHKNSRYLTKFLSRD